eukprot:403331306
MQNSSNNQNRNQPSGLNSSFSSQALNLRRQTNNNFLRPTSNNQRFQNSSLNKSLIDNKQTNYLKTNQRAVGGVNANNLSRKRVFVQSNTQSNLNQSLYDVKEVVKSLSKRRQTANFLGQSGQNINICQEISKQTPTSSEQMRPNEEHKQNQSALFMNHTMIDERQPQNLLENQSLSLAMKPQNRRYTTFDLNTKREESKRRTTISRLNDTQNQTQHDIEEIKLQNQGRQDVVMDAPDSTQNANGQDLQNDDNKISSRTRVQFQQSKTFKRIDQQRKELREGKLQNKRLTNLMTARENNKSLLSKQRITQSERGHSILNRSGHSMLNNSNMVDQSLNVSILDQSLTSNILQTSIMKSQTGYDVEEVKHKFNEERNKRKEVKFALQGNYESQVDLKLKEIQKSKLDLEMSCDRSNLNESFHDRRRSTSRAYEKINKLNMSVLSANPFSKVNQAKPTSDFSFINEFNLSNQVDQMQQKQMSKDNLQFSQQQQLVLSQVDEELTSGDVAFQTARNSFSQMTKQRPNFSQQNSKLNFNSTKVRNAQNQSSIINQSKIQENFQVNDNIDTNCILDQALETLLNLNDKAQQLPVTQDFCTQTEERYTQFSEFQHTLRLNVDVKPCNNDSRNSLFTNEKRENIHRNGGASVQSSRQTAPRENSRQPSRRRKWKVDKCV